MPEVICLPIALVAGRASGHPGHMKITWRPLLSELFAPLSLAAYAAWGVVFWETEARMQGAPESWLWLTRLALLVFLISFVFCTVNEVALSTARHAALTSVLALCALVASAYRPTGTGPILLVLTAAVLAVRLDLKGLFFSLLALNAAYLVLLLLRTDHGPSSLAVTALAYISFQAFAALVMRNAQRAESMSEELRAANAELLTSRTLLAESTRDQERLTLSRELHDVAGHTLTALKLNLGALLRDPRQPDPARVELCAGLADELLQTLRSVVQQTRASNDLDLQATISRLAVSFTRPALHLEIAHGLRLSSRPIFETVLRAAQEALTNAAKHGLARHLWVRLHSDELRLQLDIEDDGRVSWPVTAGGGLSGMRERIEQLGGELRLSVSARGGLHLRASIPWRQAQGSLSAAEAGIAAGMTHRDSAA